MPRGKQTVSDQQLINGIRKYWKEYNYSPSSRNLMAMFNVKSTATINRRLHSLKAKGLIDFVNYEPRTITVVADRLNYTVGD